MPKQSGRNSEARREAMLTENLRTLIPRMAGPTIIAQLISTVYSLADTYFVSRLGTYATAAVGVNHSLERIITIVGSLIATGASSCIARRVGARKDEEAERVLSTSVSAGMGFGILVAILGLSFSDALVNLLGATPECRQYAMDYASYVLAAAPVMIGSFILNATLRSEGSSTLAMIGMGFGGILNCALDPIFIFGLNMGVAGASLATAISKGVSFLILGWNYFRGKTLVKLRLKSVKLIWKEAFEVISIGSTAFFRTTLGVVATILINRMAGSYSTQTLAAISLGNRIMHFPFAMILGFGQGFQPVAAFNYGAKQYRRVHEALSFAEKVALVGGTGMAVILFLCAKPIIGVFNAQADGELLRLGMLCIRFECITMPIHAGITVINNFYNGSGQPKQAVLLSTARQGYCLLPALFILPRLFGAEGLCAVQAAADGLTLLPGIPLAIHAFRSLRRQEEERS